MFERREPAAPQDHAQALSMNFQEYIKKCGCCPSGSRSGPQIIFPKSKFLHTFSAGNMTSPLLPVLPLMSQKCDTERGKTLVMVDVNIMIM